MKKEVIAVDFGGTYIRTARVIQNKIHNLQIKKTPKTKQKILDLLVDEINEQKKGHAIKGVGVASPGPLNDGILKNPPNIPFKNFNLQKYLKTKCHTKIIVKNDASCVALAEATYGAAKKSTNFIVLTIGTGIGSGIVINNKIYEGNGYATEAGKMFLEEDKHFEKLWQDMRTKYPTMHMNSNKKILQKTANILARGIASLHNIFDPEVIIITGGVQHIGNSFLTQIKQETKKYNLLPSKPNLKWSQLPYPGILGASLLL